MATEAESAGMVLEQGAVLLGAALLFVTVYRRLGIGAVLGYLTAGILLGPHVTGFIPDAEAMLGVGDIGIAMLLFLVGMELNPSRLWRLKRDIFGLGASQVIVCGVILALLVGLVLDISFAAAVAIGMPLALSSTAQVLPFLRGSGEINTRPGERAFSILLLQDLAIVPMLIILTALAVTPEPDALSGGQLVLYSVGAIIGLMLAGRYLLDPLLRIVGRVSERELFVMTGLFTVLAAAAIMHLLGLSIALGAFVAGVMLAESPYRHELEADIDPFRSILLGLFFIAVGVSLDLRVLAESPLLIVASAIVLVVTKVGAIYGVARAFGVPNGQALRLGLLLSQGGEFAFVLFGTGAASGIISDTAVSMYSAVVTLSMVSTPFLMMVHERLERMSADKADTSHLAGPEEAAPARALVVGYGRFGQTVAQMLLAKGLDVVLIDSKPEQIELSGEFGNKVYYGDGTRIDLLRQAGAEDARVLMFCIDGDQLDATRLEPILEAFPQAQVFVRAFDRRQVMALEAVNVAGIYREVFESAIGMGREVLSALGVEQSEIARVERGYRDRDGERLMQQSKSGDLRAMKHTIFRPGETMDDNEGVFDGDQPVASQEAESG